MMRIEKFGNRTVCIGGVGASYFQDGIPLSIAFESLSKRGVEVSIFHVCDECLKNGWSPETTWKKIKYEVQDDVTRSQMVDLDQVYKFCYSSYEQQREMIFKYLFGSVDEARAKFNVLCQ